jgi:hypothetical protein
MRPIEPALRISKIDRAARFPPQSSDPLGIEEDVERQGLTEPSHLKDVRKLGAIRRRSRLQNDFELKRGKQGEQGLDRSASFDLQLGHGRLPLIDAIAQIHLGKIFQLAIPSQSGTKLFLRSGKLIHGDTSCAKHTDIRIYNQYTRNRLNYIYTEI